MLLNEFFGKAIHASKKVSPKKDKDKKLHDDVFWFIVDHDKLHKDFFHPIASEISHLHNSDKLDKEKVLSSFMPMVNKGCKEFYHKNKMNGHLGELFPKDLRKELCEKLFDHYHQDILKGEYKIAESAKKKKDKKTKENADVGGGKMFGNNANKSQTGSAYTSISHLRYNNGGIA